MVYKAPEIQDKRNTLRELSVRWSRLQERSVVGPQVELVVNRVTESGMEDSHSNSKVTAG